MTDETWKKIENKIKYFAEDILCKEYNKNGRVISFNGDKMEIVFERYKKYNKEIHLLMLHNELKNFQEPSKEIDNRIDRHKVASALLASIIEVQPLQINVEYACANVRTANEILSFLIGIYIVEAFANTKSNTVYRIMPPSCCHGNYIEHFVKIIYRIKSLQSDRNLNTMVLFLVSHVFFLIEQCSLKND